MSLPASLEKKIRVLSRRPAGGDTRPTSGETIVISIAAERIGQAFDEARARLAKAPGIVRVIAHAATFERSWPSWIKSEPKIVVMEPGAFNHQPFVESTRALQDDLRSWLDRVFGHAFHGRASDILYATACARFLQTAIFTYPRATSLAEAFPHASFVSLDAGHHTNEGGWDPALFEAIVARTGGKVERAYTPHPKVTAWTARVALKGALGLGGAIAFQLRDFIKARTARAELGARSSKTTPDMWLTLFPRSVQGNEPLLESIVKPALAAGKKLGVLFVRSPSGEGTWESLSELPELLQRCVVDQAVMPERFVALLGGLFVGSAASARSLVHLARNPRIKAGGESIGLESHLWAVVSLATLDVLRGVLAERAAEDVVGRHGVKSGTAITTGASSIGIGAVDTVLQRSGVTTINLPEATGGDLWTGMGTASSSARVAWTKADAREIGSSSPRVVVSGMPIRWRLAPRKRAAKNILIVNRNGHRDLASDGVFRDGVFQEELFDVAKKLAAQHGELAFRWRPDQGTIDEAIAHGKAFFPEAELSRERPIEDDAAWADIILAGYSPLVIDMLFASVPVFVQARAEWLELPVLDFITPERIFWDTADGFEKVSKVLGAIERGDPVVLAAERRAREALFGPGGEPQPLEAAPRLVTGEAAPRLPKTNGSAHLPN